ncbi:MAG: DUF2203 domain-containing protein [Bryobacteraceae bacterium]
MARFFTLLQAETLLPQLEPLLRGVIDQKKAYEQAEGEITGMSQRIALTGGMLVSREHMARTRKKKDTAVRGLAAAVEQIQDLGCQLKDADTGLIDFPTLYRGKEVYLCWKLGESSIEFWHPVEDGFRGRQRIDNEFLANHKGDAPV